MNKQLKKDLGRHNVEYTTSERYGGMKKKKKILRKKVWSRN